MDDQEPEPRYAFEIHPRRLHEQLLAAAKAVGFPSHATEGRYQVPRSVDPTPAEIAAKCREIRRGWDPREELTRRVGPNRRVPFVVPGAEMFGEVVARESQ